MQHSNVPGNPYYREPAKTSAPSRRSLTRRQRQVLDFIRQTEASTGMMPSYRQIANHVGLNAKSTIHSIVCRLKDGGHLQRTSNEGERFKTAEGGIIQVRLPPDLDAMVRTFALIGKVSPADVVIEAVRDGLKAYQPK